MLHARLCFNPKKKEENYAKRKQIIFNFRNNSVNALTFSQKTTNPPILVSLNEKSGT